MYDDRLHRIDLRWKVEKNWREEHGSYIRTWDMRQQRLCHAPPQIDEMPHDHAYTAGTIRSLESMSITTVLNYI